MDTAIKFFATLLMTPIFAIGFLALIRFMVMKEMDFLPGIACLIGLLLLMVVAVASPGPWLACIILLSLVSLMVFFPFAKRQLEYLDLREWNNSVVERCHSEIAQHPGNISAYFALAEALFEKGYAGSAIALSEMTLSGLSGVVDPTKFTSMRMNFRAEESRMNNWKKQHQGDQRLFADVRCPLCGFMNACGTLACGGCKKPYMLELARLSETKTGFIAKLCIGWIALGLAFTGIAFVGFTLTGPAVLIAILGGVVVIGGILYVLFGRSRQVSQDSSSIGW